MALIGHVLDKKGRTVWAVTPQASVHEAIQLMAARNIGAVAVVETSRVVGIFTERHYARDVFLKGRRSPTTPVGDVMRANPITISPCQHLGECIDLMERERVRHVLVVEDGVLAGILSKGDVLRAIIFEEKLDVQALMSYISRER